MTEKLKFSAEWADCTTDKNQKNFDGFKRTTRPLSQARGRRGHQKGKTALTLKKKKTGKPQAQRQKNIWVNLLGGKKI